MGSNFLQRCGSCGSTFSAPEKFLGKTVKCPKCQAPVLIAGVAEPRMPTAAPPPPARPAAKPAVPPTARAPLPNVPAAAAPAKPAAPAPGGFPNIVPTATKPGAVSVGPKTGAANPSPLARRGRRKSPNVHPLVYVAAGGGLLMLLIFAGAAYFVSTLISGSDEVVADADTTTDLNSGVGDSLLTTPAQGRGAANDDTRPSSSLGTPGASWNVFVLDLSDRERSEVKVQIDGQNHPVPDLGPVSFQLAAGEHRLQLTRPGFEPITHAFRLADNGLESYTPRWQREGAGAVTVPTGTAGGPLSFDDWLQDIEEAKRQAHAQDKDIFITFNGSDWCGWCIRLMYEVFFQQEFRDRIEEDFVLVQIDSPRKAEARGKVQNLQRNNSMIERFGVRGFPTIILADSQGQPYAQTGYVEGGVGPFLQTIETLKASRSERDQLFAAVDNSTGEARIQAAGNALAWLKENEVLQLYGPTLAGWLNTALEQDPQNANGQLEAFFELDWYARISAADRTDLAAVRPILDRLTNFNTKYKWVNGDRGARLNLIAAGFCHLHEDTALAKRFADAGLACEPEDAELLATLKAAARQLASGNILGSGSGFVVAAGGYIMTNHHVIEGEGKPFVRIAGKTEPAPAKIIAVDKKLDIALLQVTDPQLVGLKPLVVNTTAMGRGSPVGVFGYPLGDDIGTGLKLTTGIVSALPDEANDGMVLLDCRVNPGNSGGPLCDAGGLVIGMVTAKTSGYGVDSYGMARPADKLVAFLKQHVPNYAASPPVTPPDAPSWSRIDTAVSGSVLMIVMKK